MKFVCTKKERWDFSTWLSFQTWSECVALQSDWATLLERLLFDFMHLVYNSNDTHTIQQSAEFPRQKRFFCFHFQSHSAPTLNNNYELTVSCVRTRVCVSPDVWNI